MAITWVVEPNAFSKTYETFLDAIDREGHSRILWDDDWWCSGRAPASQPSEVRIFHGSLGNAHRIAVELAWSPGAYCATDEFRCSRWYDRASSWLAHEKWATSTAQELVDSPETVAGAFAKDDQVFIRPDSCLKPFAGRVCNLTGITLEHLDFGFYFDDPMTPVVIAPVQEIGREWRFVVVDQVVVAGSAYDAATRTSASGVAPSEKAQEIASALQAPEPVYVLDICETNSGLKLLELNPFSGADLYGCDPGAIVRSVSRAAAATITPREGT